MNEIKQPGVGLHIIVVRRDEVLMQHRGDCKRGKGEWAFPCGHYEVGDTFGSRALSELLEEAGPDFRVVVRKGPNYSVDIPWPDGGHSVATFVRADYVSGEPRIMEPRKCLGWKWVKERGGLPNPLYFPVKRYIEDEYKIFEGG